MIQSGGDSESAIPMAQWVIAAFGALLVVATIGFLVYRAMVEVQPPSFAVTVERMESAGDNFAVTVLIRNQGGRAVASLVVRGRIVGGEDDREATIDYLPANSGRRVTFLFDRTFESRDFTCTFISYNDP